MAGRAGKRSPGWGDGQGRAFRGAQQDVGSVVGPGLGCQMVFVGAQVHPSFMSPRTAPPVLAQVAGSLHPRTGCGPGRSLAGILLAPGLRKYRQPQGDSPRVVCPRIALGGLATRSPGQGPAQQSPLREHGTTSKGTQEGICLRRYIYCVSLAPPGPRSMGSDPSPHLLHVFALGNCFYCMFFISDFICTSCSAACFLPSAQAPVSTSSLSWGPRGGLHWPSLCGKGGQLP